MAASPPLGIPPGLESLMDMTQINQYIAIAMTAVIVYDYFLMFSREIDYVWCRPWSWVSTMFVLVRYIGLSLATLGAISGSGLPILNINLLYYEGTITFLVSNWGYLVFLTAADLVMILRVYAMWNRSGLVLYSLLFIFVAQTIVSIVFAGMYNTPNTHFSVTIPQVIDFPFCDYSSNMSSLVSWFIELPRFILGTTLLVLALAQTSKQSLVMYKATKQWQLNRYMQLLVKDGILYFLANLFANVVSSVVSNTVENIMIILFLAVISSTTLCIMMPRFIIGVRELYDRDLRGRCQGIDTGFGELSRHVASQDAILSAIEFADVAPGQGQTVEGEADEAESIRLKERRRGSMGFGS